MDEAHVHEAVRYVELNPVRAKLVNRAQDWRWSSARAHLYGQPDDLLSASPILEQLGDWRAFLGTKSAEKKRHDIYATLRRHAQTGRPLGSDEFVAEMEKRTGRGLRPGKPGRKPRKQINNG